MKTIHSALLFALFALFATACGSDDATTVQCVEGTTAACLCAEGPTFGVQTCDESGSFGACNCTGVTPPVGTDAGDAGGGGTLDATVEPDMEETDTGTPVFRLNECGGSNTLTNSPGTPCGACNDGIRVCDGVENVRCVGDTDLNACGGCAPLPAAPETPCGPCGQGTWTCEDQTMTLVCDQPGETNACGGCATLMGQPGFICNEGGQTGSWACTSSEEVRCLGPGKNACGGETVLADIPATPCGTCDDGRFECASLESIICNNPDAGANACGGCGTPLIAPPGTGCGSCGGAWECDGTTNVVCSARLNLCGGCGDLTNPLGSDCGGGEIHVCDGSARTVCADAATSNLCGGTSTLGNAPGAPCGTCGDGKYVCAGKETTTCVEDDLRTNACGGCDPLPNTIGETCAPGSIWMCDGMNDTVCSIEVTNSPFNACGGTSTLLGQPGTVCEECGTWVCDGNNPNLVFCIGGSPGTFEDEDNCGMCGNRCLPEEACNLGVCEFDKVVQIDADGRWMMARTLGGRVLGLGRGYGGDGTGSVVHETPVEASIVNDAIDIEVIDRPASMTGCAIRSSGEVWCWGNNATGLLGVPPIPLGESRLPLQVPGISTATTIAGDEGTACAILANRELWCWGSDGNSGKLGRGSIVGDSPTPAAVSGLTSIQQVAVGRAHACAVNSTGDVYCWGDDTSGALGNGAATGDSATPMLVPGISGSVLKLVAELRGTYALTTTGLYRWGSTRSAVDGRMDTYQDATLEPGSAGYQDVVALSSVTLIQDSNGEYRLSGSERGRAGIGQNQFGLVGNISMANLPSTSTIASAHGLSGPVIFLLDSGEIFVSGPSSYDVDNQLTDVLAGYFHPIPTIAPFSVETGNCHDGLDNDRDGLIDCADDDCSEDLGSVTGPFTRIVELDWLNYLENSCPSSRNLPEKIFRWEAPRSGSFRVTSDLPNSGVEMLLELRTSCDVTIPAVTCNEDDFQSGLSSEVVFTAVAGQTYYIVVESSQRGVSLGFTIAEVP